MRTLSTLLFTASAAALSLALAPDAAACGACFHGEMENTQVTGHKMIFSISQSDTTLWDQFSYTGDASSFAWVLPVKGTVDVGLSSDALFENLIPATQVTVSPPPLNCAPPPYCGGFNSSSSGSSSGGFGGGTGGGVTVVSQKVVGPYETVVLHSTDPTALATWLSTNGYVIPVDFAPVVTAYVDEGFDFLALKLIPGKDITSMKPVRVTTPGAGASLPLRMVAAGVGVTTPITLWIFGEGRYQPQNFPWFVITDDQLVWDFATSASNYKALRQAGFDATLGRGWLMEASSPFSEYTLTGPLQDLVMYQPMDSGYGDDTTTPADALTADLDKLWAGISPTSLWVSRMYAELPRTALSQDLSLGAAQTQAPVVSSLQAKKAINIPECPTYPPCPDTSSSSSSSSGGGAGGSGGALTGTPRDGGGSCAVGGSDERSAALGALALAAGLALARRRRRA
jgi:uncharacterized membrane protein YgcG